MYTMSEFKISSLQSDLDMVYRFLNRYANWNRGISCHLLERAIKNSLCFDGFFRGKQIAFARVISDYATFANLVDIFVLPEYRGNGYAKVLLSNILAQPELQGFRRFILATAEAHALYRQFGLTALKKPENLMERYFPEIYQTQIP